MLLPSRTEDTLAGDLPDGEYLRSARQDGQLPVAKACPGELKDKHLVFRGMYVNAGTGFKVHHAEQLSPRTLIIWGYNLVASAFCRDKRRSRVGCRTGHVRERQHVLDHETSWH